MTNQQINRYLKSMDDVRSQWINILVKNPNHTEAALMVISINSKMELLRALWNWNDATVEMNPL